MYVVQYRVVTYLLVSNIYLTITTKKIDIDCFTGFIYLCIMHICIYINIHIPLKNNFSQTFMFVCFVCFCVCLSFYVSQTSSTFLDFIKAIRDKEIFKLRVIKFSGNPILRQLLTSIYTIIIHLLLLKC